MPADVVVNAGAHSHSDGTTTAIAAGAHSSDSVARAMFIGRMQRSAAHLHHQHHVHRAARGTEMRDEATADNAHNGQAICSKAVQYS